MFLVTVSNENSAVMDPTPALHFLVPEEDMLDLTTTAVPNITSVNGSTTYVRDEKLARVEIAVQAVIFVFALFGNGFVLLALRYRKRKTSRMHVFIMHLSIADILVALLNILPQLAWDITFRFQGSDAACRIIKYLQIMVIYLSTYILVMTAIDRYRAICHPLSNYSWTTRKSHVLVGIAWVISAILSIPQLIIFKIQKVDEDSEEIDCWVNFYPEWTLQLYITSFSFTVFFLPSVILSFLYGRICYVVWRNVYSRTIDIPETCTSTTFNGIHNSVVRTEIGPIRYKFTGKGHISVIPEKNGRWQGGGATRGRSHCITGISKAKMKTIQLTFVVIIAYMACWLPFITTQMWWAFDEKAPLTSSTFVICLLLVSLNSCCNPWIYMAFSESLVQQVVPCCRKKNNRKPPEYYQRERIRMTPTAYPKADPADSDDENRYDEGTPLQDRLRNDDLRRKSTLLSRTTSTKLSTLNRTDSKPTRQNKVIMRYSREHGIMAATNVARWPCSVGYTPKSHQKICSTTPLNNRVDTKMCECKQCLNAMADKANKKKFLSSWRERNEERENSKSSGSSSSSRKGRPSSKEHDRDSVGKQNRTHSDNGNNVTAYRSDQGIIAEDMAKFSSV